MDEPRSWARRLTITVPAERVALERKNVAKRVATRVNLPGFRKGKAPSSVIEKKYGPAIEQEALEHVVQHAFREAVRAQGFRPISEGSVGQMDYTPGSDLTFQVEFEVRPEIELSRLGGFTVDAPAVAVGEDEVEKVLDRLREERADWQPLAESDMPKPGDRVNVEITQVHDDHEHAGRPYELVLGKDQAIPDVEAAIQTLRPGTDSEFEIEVPANEETGAGTELQKVRIRLLAAERAALPALDDDFAKAVGEDLADVAALRERIRADLRAEADANATRQLRRDLIDQVVQANPFDVPDAMVRQYVNSMFQIGEDADQERVRDLYDVARPGAETAIRRMLVVERIVELHGLRATQDEVDARVEDIAKRNGRPVGEVWSSLQRSGRLHALEDEITEGKVFEYLKAQSTIRGA
ncbi:MAG TPA: trigger factor [Longimicrobiales bacterium]|nr:trigger factor [Longimicrobiales bacterium]